VYCPCAAQLRRGEDRTDWERVRNPAHEEIEASVDFEDQRTFDLGLAFKGPIAPKQQITVHFDTVAIHSFKSQGPGYQTRMSAALRHYTDRNIATQSIE